MKTSNALRVASSVSSPSSPSSDRTATAARSHGTLLEALFERASRGDRNAVAAIGVSYRWIILREAKIVLGRNDQDAEDVLQEAMLELLEGLWPYQPSDGHPGTWLRRTVQTIAKAWRDARERDWGRP